MTTLKAVICPFVTILVVFTSSGNCVARDQLISEEGKIWVAGRHKNDPYENSGDVIGVMIKVEADGPGKRIRATLWTCSDVKNGHYKTIEELTDHENGIYLEGEVARKGPGKHMRQEVELKNDDYLPQVKLFMSGLWRRKKGMEPTEEVIMCRVRFYPEKIPVNCDEPPTEDVLEEEPIVDINMDGVPDAPEYYEP